MSSPPHPFSMPPEWAPHRATWLSWPWNPETWPDKVSHAEHTVARWVRELTRPRPHLHNGRPPELVEILVLGETHRAYVQAILDCWCIPRERYRLHAHRTNDSWIRDYGPIFTTRPADPGDGLGTVRITDWEFDAWGGKGEQYYGGNNEFDNAVPSVIADICGLPKVSPGLVLEGGSIEVNGAGTLMSTRECLLDARDREALGENEAQQQAALERILGSHLGVRNFVWVEGVAFEGDDTDGHIDNIARFVSRDTLVAVSCPDPLDPLHEPLAANIARLREARDQDGQPFRVLPLELPESFSYAFNRDGDGPEANIPQRLPASYANFYIGNHVVLVPTYADRRDLAALRLLAELFPDRDVVGIDCCDYILGLGAIHCSTQQEPLG